MSSHDEIKPAELPTDSKGNASDDSLLPDSNSNTTFCTSEAGLSNLISGNTNPNNDTVQNEEGNSREESFISSSDNLAEDNSNSHNPFKDEHSNNICRKSTSQQCISMSNVSSSDESEIDTETSLSESLISKYETFTYASLPRSYLKNTEVEVDSDKLQSINYDYTLGQEINKNSTAISIDETRKLMPNYVNKQEGNVFFNSKHLSSETDGPNNRQFSTNSESNFFKNEEGVHQSNAYFSDQNSELGEIFNNKGISVCLEENDFSNFLNESCLSQTGTFPLTHDTSVSEQETSHDIQKMSRRNDIHEENLFASSIEFSPVGIHNAIQESNADPILQQDAKQINNLSKTTVFPEAPLDETEAYQLKEIQQINSDSIAYEDACWNIIDLSNSEDSVSETQKCYIKMPDFPGKIDAFTNRNDTTECVNNHEECRYSEQSNFEITNLSTENDSLDKDLELAQNFCISAKNISSQNTIDGNGVISGKEDYPLIVDENCLNETSWSEFASSETNMDLVKKVEVHGNSLEIRNDCNSWSTTNNSTNQLCTESCNRRKYQELKDIINNFFESYDVSSLHENQRKETLMEVAAVIGTTNIPISSRNSSSMDKKVKINNNSVIPQSDNKSTEDYKLQHQVFNMNETSTTEISIPPVQDIANSNLINTGNSKKDENITAISKAGVNSNKKYDFDNSGDKYQSTRPLLNESNYDSNNFGTNKTEFKFLLHESFSNGWKRKERCMKREAHIPVEYPKNNTIHSLNNTSPAETNDHSVYQKIPNTECQNAASASFSNSNYMQTDFTADYVQNADTFKNTGNIFAVQRSTIDRKQTAEIKNTEENIQRNVCSLKSKRSTEIKSSSLANDGNATLSVLNESNETENCISCNNNPIVMFEKNIDVKKSDEDISPDDSKSRYAEAKKVKNPDTYEISNYDSESLYRQAKTAKYKNDEGNALTFASSSTPLIVSKSNKGYLTENEQSIETCHHLESVQSENKSQCESDYHKDTTMKSVQSNTRKVDPSPIVKELLAIKDKHKKLNNANAEKHTHTRISPKHQSISSQIDSKKAKSCKIQSKSLRTSYPLPMKDERVSNLDFNSTCAVAANGNKESNKVCNKKRTPKSTTLTDLSISSQKESKRPKSCKIHPKSLCTTFPLAIKEERVSSLDFNSTCAKAANGNKQLNNVCNRKKTPKRISSTDISMSSQGDSKKPKSCEVQPKSLCTNFPLAIKKERVSSVDLNSTCAVAANGNKQLNNICNRKKTPKRTSSTSISSQRDSKKPKSCKVQSKSLCTTYPSALKEDNVSSLDFNAAYPVEADNLIESNNVYNTKRTPKRTSLIYQSVSSQKDYKKVKSCKMQPKLLYTTCNSVMKGDFVSAENSQKICMRSDIRNLNEESSSSSSFQMSQILKKFNNKGRETSTSTSDEFMFGPRKFINKIACDDPTLSLDNSCENVLVAPTVFDHTLAAVKQLNNGKGSTVTEIISNVRKNFPSSDKKLSLDIKKALKNATATGILTFADGKYKQTPPLIEANTSKKTGRKETNRVNDNKILSNRVKPTPSQLRSSRPKTTRATKSTSAKKPK